MINAVAKAIAFDFFVDGEWAILRVVVKFHLRGVKTGFAVDEIADGGVFNNHFGPERVAGETEEVSTLVGSDFDNDVGPASDDVFGFFDFFVGKSGFDDVFERVIRSKKICHSYIIS